MATETSFAGLPTDLPTMVAGSNGSTDPQGLVSVVVPCCGQLEHLRLSVPRVLRHSRPPFELLFVDAGSLDGTADYLQGVKDAAPVRVEVVRAPEEDDFNRAVDEALGLSRGAFVAWLSPDALVPGLWLNQLVGLAVANDRIGLVGPVANVAQAEQRVAVGYRPRRASDEEVPDLEAFDRFAAEHREQNRGKWSEVEKLGGFCLLIKREVLAQVGLLEQGAEAGVFDAGRLGARVRRAGWHLACCRDLLVHHGGTSVEVR